MNRKRVLKQLEGAVNALEKEILRLDPGEGEWTFFFQLLRCYGRFDLVSYREQLLIGNLPECVLETPYCTAE